ncbi:hypothetical protein TRIUR3_00624 [Triticum urartu]|uniref:Wall-associated receptor kinase galacturonan-binding domain-containing protein n=1 Tax=Triticum urartu TaxID=4572 RepID=M7YGU6_TRIUA|nr:hypothetical protein TRIUR3_00624 [Triticum urartu]
MAARLMPPAVVILASFLLLRCVYVVDAAECEPVACGNFTIKYPFWLGAPRRPPPEPSCGHPAFELWCIDGNTTASMSGSPLHVHSIDYATRSFVVYHNRVASGTDGVCRADFNVSSSLALSPFNISPTNQALCFLSDCKNGTEPRGPQYVNATGKPIFAYLGGSYDRDRPPAIDTGTCTYNYLPGPGAEAALGQAPASATAPPASRPVASAVEDGRGEAPFQMKKFSNNVPWRMDFTYILNSFVARVCRAR